MSSSPISNTRSLVRPRSSTRGPLDPGENPILSAAHHRMSIQPIPRAQSTPISPQLPGAFSSPFGSPRHRSATPSQRGGGGARSATPSIDGRGEPPAFVDSGKDFAFLLRPEIYHPISNLTTPTAFRASAKQPLPTDSLDSLLARGHFRAAAIAAAQELTSTGLEGGNGSSVPPKVDPLDARRIFSLIYTRLVCLVLVDATTLAAQEGKLLEDLNGPRYVDAATGEHLVPWELRVLNVRLQGIAFGDPHRTVMSYYDLAREARAQVMRARAVAGGEKPTAADDDSDGSDRDRARAAAELLWTHRLHDLGVRVAGALVEMNDLVGAAQHLSTLKADGQQDGKLALARALVWLQVGDTDAAMHCVRGVDVGHSHADKIVAALCDMATGAYAPALEKWTALGDVVKDEMVAVNTATCLLYLGRIGEGRDLLEGLVGEGYKSHTLLFNLATMYELCSDHSKDMKLRLADRLVDLDLGALGWEKTTTDLKL